MNWLEAAVRWYGVLFVATWCFAPAVRWFCRGLTDRGTSIARPLALLGAIYPAWLLSSTVRIEFGFLAVAGTILIVGVAGWLLAWRRGAIDRAWVRDLVVAELASLICFALYVWLRGYTPQILGTEKPMDIAFLASSARTTVMPPPDPWFAGEPINYYYLGYLLHGTLARLAGVAPEVGFNLALATIFSMMLVAGFGLAWNAIKPSLGARLAIFGGAIAAFFLAIAGNLYAPSRLIADARATVAASWWDSTVGIGWRSSRIVCDGARAGNLCPPPATETINEFPFFSFLLGDLHPHLMALPFTLVAIALALNLAYSDLASPRRRGWWVTAALTGVVVGALYLLNAWDYPTALLIVLIGLWAGAGRTFKAAWKPAVLLIVSSILPWLPYWISYVPPAQPVDLDGLGFLQRLPILPRIVSTLSLNSIDYTSIGEYLTIFGVGYASGILLLGAGIWIADEDARRRQLRTAAYAAALTVPFAVVLGSPVIPLCGVPLAVASHQLLRTRMDAARASALVLFGVAWLLSIAVELVYVRDVFNDRMNTLFKFYYQTWTLYALGIGIALALLWNQAPRAIWRRIGLAAATVLALIAGASYPVVATYQWTNHLEDWQGLDGLAYAVPGEADEVAAIRWLAQHAQPGDVVLEAAGCSYRPFNRLPYDRVSAFTGVPTIIGWGDNHQRQWRSGEPDLLDTIPQRQADVAAIYADPRSRLVQTYGINWLFVGEYEAGSLDPDCRTAGPYAGVEDPGFPGPGWREAFSAGNTHIYRRTG